MAERDWVEPNFNEEDRVEPSLALDPRNDPSESIDLFRMQQLRDRGEPDNVILKDLVSKYGTELIMDGQPFSLKPALDNGSDPRGLLDALMAGKKVDKGIDSQGTALLSGAATAVTNTLGLVPDLVNMGTQSIEGLGRKAINYAGGNVSENPQDFIASSPNPVGGGQWWRDSIERAYNPVLEASGLSELAVDYVDSADQVPEKYRAAWQAARVVTENAIPAIAILKAVKLGIGLNNPLLTEAATNPALFIKTEASATTGATALVVGTELVGLGDNPWAMMGAEFIGAIIGGNVPGVVTGTKSVYGSAGKTLEDMLAAISPEAARKGAVNEILVSAEKARTELLNRATQADSAGDSTLAARLRSEADDHTPERMISDIQTALALGADSPSSGISLPAGTLTDNPTLMAIQNTLMSKNPDFKTNVIDDVKDALNTILNTSELLARAGNNVAADTLLAKYYQSLLDVKLNSLQAEAAAQVNKLGGTATAGQASTVAQRTIFEAKDNIRKMETYLWGRIPEGTTVQGDAIAKAINNISNNKLLDGLTIGGGGQVDEVISRFFARASDPAQTITAKEVLKFRSIMLAQSRKAAGADDFFQAGIFDELAGASIDDLSNLPIALVDESIKSARQFSFELNTRFTRYFNQKVSSTEAKGGTSIRSPEILDEAMTGGDNASNLNMTELRDAAQYADTMGTRVENVKQGDALLAEQAKAEAKRAAEAGVNDIVMPQELTGPPSTAVARQGAADTSRMPQKDRPANVDSSYNKQADELYAFAKQMDEAGKPDMAAEARKRAKVLAEYRGPEGEQYFDPSAPAAEPAWRRGRSGPGRQPGKAATDAPFEEGPSSMGTGGDIPETAVTDPNVILELGPTMTKAQDDYLRATALKLKDTNNVISVDAVNKFMADNVETLKAFPNFKAELLALGDAQRAADTMMARFGEVIKTGKLPDAIQKAINSNNPREEFASLAAEAITPEAMDDFRLATMDAMFTNAKTLDGKPNFFDLANRLTKPLSGRKGDVSVLDEMVANGVITTEAKDAIGGLLAEGVRIQKSTLNTNEIQQLVTGTSDLVGNAARIFGANIGATFGRGEGSQLQAAAIGSAFFKKLVSGLPVGNKLEQMEILMLQPELLAKMMSENPTIRKGALQVGKEAIIKYGSTFKGKNLVTGTAKLVGDVSVVGATKLGTATAKAAANAPIASAGALSGNAEDNRRPDLRTQMQEAFPQ
jgi:hypothetical protein